MTPRVVLVEDEPLVSMMMEDLLTDLGCEVAASFGALAPALAWLSSQERLPDGAVLDVNLGGGETVFPLAEALRARGVPFVFATGYGVLPSDGYPDTPLIRKPVNQDQLLPVVRAFAALA
ncbi:MAG: response regulator [Phenylobacterium sp.]|uniref:response regulator n=1 Tax=Phenylobacterium sp. TaxID=1871053 RepID=UPI0025DC1E79|nr:response regulator [Phenylobacterium sp.]MBA4014341.1 response regulator [Phenylobacterium sp.]